MKAKFLPVIFAVIVIAVFSVISVSAALPGVINAADFIEIGTGADVADELQRIIDENPNRTIWIPDGEYILSKTVCTPADPTKSVDLQLSNYAVIKASDDFEGGALISLGGKDAFNTTSANGSNYSLTGGIIDGNGIADGISIMSGRETKIQNTSVKNTVTGIYIGYGANSGSADADIRDVNIIGNGTKDAVGMLIEGYDNTFTNIRIGRVYTGVILRSAGNALTNIHPLYELGWDIYEGSCGFVDEGNNNLYTYCYSDQFETCFKIKGNARNIYDNCFGFWWSGEGKKAYGFVSEGSKFDSVVTNTRIDFRHDTNNTVYKGPVIGSGEFDNLLIDKNNVNGDLTYKVFTKDSGINSVKLFLEKIEAFFIYIKNFFERLFNLI